MDSVLLKGADIYGKLDKNILGYIAVPADGLISQSRVMVENKFLVVKQYYEINILAQLQTPNAGRIAQCETLICKIAQKLMVHAFSFPPDHSQHDLDVCPPTDAFTNMDVVYKFLGEPIHFYIFL